MSPLREYLTVSENEPRVEHYKRMAPKRWELTDVYDPSALLELKSIACTLPLTEIYDRVVFE